MAGKISVNSAKAAVLGQAPRDPALARNLPARWIGYYRVLLALRRRLLDDRRDEWAGASNPLEPHGMSLADTASDEFDHDMMLSELSAHQDRLFEIDEALRRIENDTYGVCEVTGRPIPRERLRAVPWTRFCEEAAAQLEERQSLGRAHFGEVHSVRSSDEHPLASAEGEEEVEEMVGNEAGGSGGGGEQRVGNRKVT